MTKEFQQIQAISFILIFILMLHLIQLITACWSTDSRNGEASLLSCLTCFIHLSGGLVDFVSQTFYIANAVLGPFLFFL